MSRETSYNNIELINCLRKELLEPPDSCQENADMEEDQHANNNYRTEFFDEQVRA